MFFKKDFKKLIEFGIVAEAIRALSISRYSIFIILPVVTSGNRWSSFILRLESRLQQVGPPANGRQGLGCQVYSAT